MSEGRARVLRQAVYSEMQNRDAEKTNRERAYPKKSLAVTSQAPVRPEWVRLSVLCSLFPRHGGQCAWPWPGLPGRASLRRRPRRDLLQGIDSGGHGVA